MKKILLTGSSGFTGQYIQRELEIRGYETIGVSVSPNCANDIICDLTNKSSVLEMMKLVRPDAIIHLAAIAFVGHDDEKAFYDINIFAAMHLLEAAEEIGLPLEKVIIASSANIYGIPDVKFVDENQIPNPINHYAMSKLSLEYMVKLWFDKYQIILTRPFNYTGIGQNEEFLIPKIVKHFKMKSKVIELGNLDISRDFSDVRDIAKAYVKLLESSAKSEIVNLCSGKIYSLKSIVEKMNKISGYEIEVQVNQNFVRANEIKELGGNNNKLHTITGFKPKIPMEKTLTDMYSV